MEGKKVQRKLESIILDLEAARDMETKYQIHDVMSKGGEAFITGFKEDFAEEFQALERAYNRSLKLLDKLTENNKSNDSSSQ